MPKLLQAFSAALLKAFLTLPVPSVARDDHDHDRARAALQAGEILPLPVIMARVDELHPGQVPAVELENENGLWHYEIKLLEPGGGLLKLDVDARSGRILRQKQKGAHARPGR